MSNTKHTPGPWLIGGRVTGHGIGIRVTTISSGLVASVGDNDARCAGLHKMYASQHYDNDSTRVEVMEANARLITAAPDQHEEMVRHLTILERLEADPELWARMTKGTGIATLNAYRAAIAKATAQ